MFKLIPYWITMVVGVAILPNAVSQPIVKPVLTLNGVVEATLKHYPSILSREAQIHVGHARVEDAKHAWLPSAYVTDQMTLGTDNSLNGSYFPMGIIPSASGGRRAENKYGVAGGNIAAITASWEVYNFGAYDALTSEAIASLHIDEAGLEKERFYLTSSAIQTYFDLVKYRYLLNIQQRNIERAQTIKTAVKAFADNGLKPGVDTSVADAELSKARLVYLELANAFALTRSQLSILTGLDTTSMTPDTTMNNKIQNFIVPLQTIDTGAMAQHPYVQFYKAILEDNISQQNLIRKSYQPKIFLMGSSWLRGSSISASDVYDNDPLTGLLYSRANYLAGAAITYDLFAPRKMKYKLDLQKYRTEVARANVEEQKAMVNSIQSQAGINMQTAVNRLQEIPRQAKAANDAYQQKLALYNAGLANIVDLTNALYLLNRAETDTVQANDAAWKAVIQKAFADNQVNQFISLLSR